jgi:hypothetical protein
MKRILCFVLVCFCFSATFAKEKTFESFGFQFSVPMIFESEVEYGVKVNSTIESVGFGMNALTLYSEKYGMFASLDLFFPQRIKLKLSYNGQTEAGVLDRSNYYSFWGMDAMFCFAMKVFQNETNLFTISPGIHYEMISAEAQDSSLAYTFGLGLNIQDYISLNEKVFLMFGANIAYDFIGFGFYNADVYSITSNVFIFSPKIGIEFKL